MLPSPDSAPAPAGSPYDTSDDDTAIDAIDYAGDEPDAKALLDAVQESLGSLGDYHDRLQAAHETRYTLWNGQSADGRKWASNIGRPPFPWDGCSDYRAKLAEEVILENVARIKAAVFRGQYQATAQDIDKMPGSQTATRLLNYVMKALMQPDLRDQIDFAAQWQQTYGLSILHVRWQTETRMEPVTVTLDQIVEMALAAAAQSPMGQQLAAAQDVQGLGALGQQSVEETLALIQDPANERTVAEQIQSMAPHLSPRQARAIVSDLRETGASTYPAPRTAVNRPKWQALRAQVDVFFPRETRDLQAAPWVAVIEDYTRDQLRDMERVQGWSREFIDAVEQNQRGKRVDEAMGGISTSLSESFLRTGIETGSHRSYGTVDEQREGLYQVIRIYYRAVDRRGFPGVFEAVLHPGVPGVVGKAGLAPCAHGQYPFVAFRRERTVPALIESRGVPEILETDQAAVKVQRDSRTDRTELNALPPLIVSSNRGGGRYPLHPGAQVPARANSTTEFLRMPTFDTQTLEIEQAFRDDTSRYFGRHMKDGDPATMMLKQQEVVDDFLTDLIAAVKLTWADCQQYLSPTTIARVGGVGAQSMPTTVTRDEIQGQYDFTVTFDVRDLDMEFLTKKLGLLNDFVLTADTLGVVDRAAWAQMVGNAIDPNAAALILRDPQEAQADEIDDEKRALAMISAGVEPAMIEGGQNHAARLQVLQQAIQANPQLMQRYQEEGDEIFKALVDARMQHHSHQVEQQQNAVTGRMGAAPVLGV